MNAYQGVASLKIIYYCYGSSHSSVVAASLHLGLLPIDRRPSSPEILALPHYDRTSSEDIGRCFLMGRDELGNEVYIMGMGHAKKIVRRAIESILQIYHLPTSDILFVDALPQVGLITRVGGFLSRRIGFVSLGRPLTVYGIRRCYPNFLRLVRTVKERLITCNTFPGSPPISVDMHTPL